MSRMWKEPYSLERAVEVGVHELEAGIIVCWDEQGVRCLHRSQLAAPEPDWIYFVHVCDFTFAFFSLHMIQQYLNYYSQKVLPSRIRDTPHCNHPLRQDVFTRLPLYLREEPKRLKVIKALERAIKEFTQ